MKFVAIGECMIELSDLSERDTGNRNMRRDMRLQFAGDTLNTTVYFKRACNPDQTAAYMTALGDDPYSEAMVAEWQAEDIDTSLVARLAGELPGLYTIKNDAAGERQFYYWRSAAAVRHLFDEPTRLEALAAYDLVYLSGITLAVLPDVQRQLLLDWLINRGAKVKVAFDPNFRPRLWPDPTLARQLFDTVFRCADYILVSADDMQATHTEFAHPTRALDYLQNLGGAEVVLRRGKQSCLIRHEHFLEVPAIPVEQVDSTGAGDAFNGTYLAHRSRGASPLDAAKAAHQIAARVVQVKGAILPR